MSRNQHSLARALKGYARARMNELALPGTLAAGEPLAEWALRRIRLDGRPFSFEGHEYQRALYDDPARHIVLVKGTQIGGTVWAILRTIHACAKGLTGIYLFPTKTDVNEFSKARVAPMLQENPFLGKLIRDTDTVGLKRIGDGYLYLRGMQSSVGLKSVPGDLLVFDELDEAPPSAKAMALERLAHSDYRRVVELSNPSLPDYGIDAAYQESDQRHWTIRCPACGHWTALDKEFPRTLGQDVRIIRQDGEGRFFRACPKCDAELDLAQGEWVAGFPGRDIHGYAISQLISSKVDPGEILREYRRTRFADRFYNLKIGIAWADVQNRLDAATVLAHCGDHGLLESSSHQEPCTMGVDTGKDLHVVISRFKRDDTEGRREVVYIGVAHSYADLDALMTRYNVGTCVIDALPEIHATRAFAERQGGRVLMNYFVESQRGAYDWDYKQSIVRENRTEAMDASRQLVRDGKIIFPRGGELMQEFASHMAADVKQLVENEETGAQAYRYIRTGTNHYSLAFTYDCIAWSRDVPTGLHVGGWLTDDEPFHDPILDAEW